MNFPFFIARRYLFSKKSTHVINIISSISVIGVAVATMALVIVLSVFNGFHDLVASLFTSFDPQLKVVPVEGKTVSADDPILPRFALPQVDVATEWWKIRLWPSIRIIRPWLIKGVDDNFQELTHITDILYGDGTFLLACCQFGIWNLGYPLAQTSVWERNGMVSENLCSKEGRTVWICPILMMALLLTRSTLLECCLLLSSRSMIRIISSLLLHLPVICLDSKVCSLIGDSLETG